MHLLLRMLFSLRDVDNYLYCYWSRLGIVRKRLTINPTKTWSSCGHVLKVSSIADAFKAIRNMFAVLSPIGTATM